VHLTARELAGPGFVVAGAGSDKTSFLQLLVEASAGRVPVLIVDPKGSPALEQTLRDYSGVTTLDGAVPADLLDPRRWQVPDLLLESEDYALDARAYRDAAHQRALWAAWALTLRHETMDLAPLRHLHDRAEPLRALEPYRWLPFFVGLERVVSAKSPIRAAPTWPPPSAHFETVLPSESHLARRRANLCRCHIGPRHGTR
jgi:hypothetical protein